MPHMLSRSRALIAVLALVVSGALSQGVVAAADAAVTTPTCTDSWASPVSGSWANPAMWTGGVPTFGVACITVPGSYQVTLPSGDTFAGQVVVGDGTGAGQESLVIPGCGPRNRLFVSYLDVAPGGILDLQDGQSCPTSTAIVNAVITKSQDSTMTLGGTVLAEEQTGSIPNYLVASAITNTGTITDNSRAADRRDHAVHDLRQSRRHQWVGLASALRCRRTGSR